MAADISLSDVGSIATAIGVAFAAWQVGGQRVQFRTAFQDGLWREQRDILAALMDDEHSGTLQYRYFDLCNEQALYARRGRIGRYSWSVWREAMLRTMQRPVILESWTALGAEEQRARFSHLASVLDGSHRLPWRRDPRRRLT